uniref:Pectate lyase n=1 Tax=Lilium longiflorum TaxID=4690 RepID=PLY_LILLO|nr:RecName: Full=Pectate lyase; Flags: Precursor [Lilium longiflorum]AAA33398.1 pectate lyase [Lilium longiflorum]CAA78976.1 pectate lyase [Lilium longiflorum]
MKAAQFFLYSLLFFASAALSSANIAEFDEYWQKKSKVAQAKAKKAYTPHPEEVTNHFNKAVHSSFEGNSTRRNLRTNKLGQCLATNPIDRCWRCKKNWSANRKDLVKCVKGFGRKTTGGAAGEIYVVTDPSDDSLTDPKFGTLRWGVIQDRPLWIIFGKSMVIRLKQELIINNDKTIDGRGANVQIAGGAQLTVQFVHNVIIHGIHIHDIKPGEGGLIRDSEKHSGIRTRSDGDGISIIGSSNIWIDHVSLARCSDGLIDVILGSTAITISNCHLTEHDDVMLLGASDTYTQDEIMQVTVAFNHFGRGLVQRMPRCRYGFVHVVNNDYTHWIMYAVGGSQHPTIISQGNRYIAPHIEAAKEVTKRDYAEPAEWSKWTWKSQGDLFVSGAFFVESGGPFENKYSKKDLIKAKPGTFVQRLTRFSGALNCKENMEC